MIPGMNKTQKLKKGSMIIQRTTSIDNMKSVKEVRLPVEMETKLQSMLSKAGFNNFSMLYKYAKTASNFEIYKGLIEHFIDNKSTWNKYYHANVDRSFKYGHEMVLPIEEEVFKMNIKSTELLNWILLVKPHSFKRLLFSLPQMNDYLF